MITIGLMTGEFEAVADVATGALAARSIDGAGGDGHGAHGGLCLNCGTALIGPHCHGCGQAGHVHRTASALFHDIAHGVFHFEGRTWHTLPLLFWHPGDLTRRYIHGERVKFVSPMALFLFSVFLMVATFSWVGGPTGHKSDSASKVSAAHSEANAELRSQTRLLAKLQAKRAGILAKGGNSEDVDEDIAEARTELAALRLAGAKDSTVITSKLGSEGEGFRTGVPGVDNVIRNANENPSLTAYKLQSSAYKFSWALIPISLPFIWMLFMFRRDVGMYDHAIFATYSLSAMTLMVVGLSVAAAIGIWQALIWLTLLFFPPWHMYRQLKEAYGLGRFAAIWRTFALIIAAYTSALIFFIFLTLSAGH